MSLPLILSEHAFGILVDNSATLGEVFECHLKRVQFILLVSLELRIFCPTRLFYLSQGNMTTYRQRWVNSDVSNWLIYEPHRSETKK
jgi:hypothetical protein